MELSCNEEDPERVLVLPSGPADELETCSLLFTELIHRAKKRVWIVSPYFVPDDAVMSALKIAALQGVDVRIMLPEKADNLLVYLASFTFLEVTVPVGIKVYRYTEGFLHQKVFLVDDSLAGVGTANLDNRSFRLNFEITLLYADRKFSAKVEEMLLHDFACCRELTMTEINQRPWWFVLATKIARLFSPVLCSNENIFKIYLYRLDAGPVHVSCNGGVCPKYSRRNDLWYGEMSAGSIRHGLLFPL